MTVLQTHTDKGNVVKVTDCHMEKMWAAPKPHTSFMVLHVQGYCCIVPLNSYASQCL